MVRCVGHVPDHWRPFLTAGQVHTGQTMAQSRSRRLTRGDELFEHRRRAGDRAAQAGAVDCAGWDGAGAGLVRPRKAPIEQHLIAVAPLRMEAPQSLSTATRLCRRGPVSSADDSELLPRSDSGPIGNQRFGVLADSVNLIWPRDGGLMWPHRRADSARGKYRLVTN